MEQLCAEAVREYQKLLLAGLELPQASATVVCNSSAIFPDSVCNTSLSPTTDGPRPIFSLAEQPKPQHSYIGLIAMALLSSPHKKMVLSEVYEWIMTNYPYFRSRGSGWRNSIRHNLSLNDCFIKAGRATNGKGHYWAIHPACLRDFERGDFRRRRAQRKVRRHMGLTVPAGDSSDSSPCSTPVPPTLNTLAPVFPLFALPTSFSLPSSPTSKPSFTIDNLLKDVLRTEL